jgi:hypothetical protein
VRLVGQLAEVALLSRLRISGKRTTPAEAWPRSTALAGSTMLGPDRPNHASAPPDQNG